MRSTFALRRRYQMIQRAGTQIAMASVRMPWSGNGGQRERGSERSSRAARLGSVDET
jgi:hypothetical protein